MLFCERQGHCEKPGFGGRAAVLRDGIEHIEESVSFPVFLHGIAGDCFRNVYLNHLMYQPYGVRVSPAPCNSFGLLYRLFALKSIEIAAVCDVRIVAGFNEKAGSTVVVSKSKSNDDVTGFAAVAPDLVADDEVSVRFFVSFFNNLVSFVLAIFIGSEYF